MTLNKSTSQSQATLNDDGAKNVPSQVGLAMVDAHGLVMLFNCAAEQLLGYVSSEVVGKPLETLVCESDRSVLLGLISLCSSDSEVNAAELGRRLSMLHKSGRLVPVVVGLTPVALSSSAVPRHVLVDFTTVPPSQEPRAMLADAPPYSNEQSHRLNEELKCLIAQLQESEQKYRTLYEGSPVMHANVDPHDATIKNCNQLLVERLGHTSKEQILGKSIYSLYHENCHSEVKKAFQQFVEQDKVDNVELSLKCSSGHELPVILNVSAVKNERGEILYSSSTWSDISELKRYTNELERVNHDLQEFTYVATHDLKAPLRAISHLSAWLEEDLKGSLTEESAKHLEQLKSRTARMDKLLSDLLEYSRAGRLFGERIAIDLDEVLESILELDKRDNFTVDNNLKVTQMEGYRIPLETVLRNLISNALKHHDCSSGQILVANEQADDCLHFCVSDDGPGIKPDLYQKAFTMFQTLKPRDEVEGSGMGLAIVKRIVESNGGKIWIEENQPRGSKVCFTWPS